MDEIIIRKATIIDLEELYQFEQGVIAAERPYDSTLKNKLIASGYARIEEAKPYLKHANHAWLGFMYVLRDYRGKGINKKIVEALKKWAFSKNVKELRLEVYFDNMAAIKAYEKIGFSKHMIEMRFNLEE